MFKFIKDWIKKDKGELDAFQFQEGYAEAARRLLQQGDNAIPELENFVRMEKEVGRASPYEDGILKAVHDYNILVIKTRLQAFNNVLMRV